MYATITNLQYTLKNLFAEQRQAKIIYKKFAKPLIEEYDKWDKKVLKYSVYVRSFKEMQDIYKKL